MYCKFDGIKTTYVRLDSNKEARPKSEWICQVLAHNFNFVTITSNYVQKNMWMNGFIGVNFIILIFGSILAAVSGEQSN